MTFIIKYAITIGLILLIGGTFLGAITNWNLLTSLPAGVGLGWTIVGLLTLKDRKEVFGIR